ncbi:energy transducer TonB [Rhizobium sp. BK418]|uniref:energy transducer TonB family protein n=1 Tax=Rhizobium sp. BK418 TaxID=2512120 RepID=UPI0010516990|nr:energy transducer TonB [Rhizobium sp. BK418]TCS04541.1 outer membrane transport energization protein TonB [Rhizobium sp. BK418]
MAISAKSRSRHVLIEEAGADDSLNDNNPGHELSDLRNAQRQPAGEQVIHYARFAQISSFPDHPEAAPASSLAPPPMDAAAEKQEGEKAPVRRRLTVICICSLIFHAALATVLIVAFPKAPEEGIKEAGQAVNVVMYGDSDVDQTAVGETETTVQEEIVAEAVEPDTIRPTETATAEVQPETVQPTEAVPVETQDPVQRAPAAEITRVSPETSAAVEPEILVSEVPAEQSVVQPMSMIVPEQTAPVDTVISELQPSEVPPTDVQPAAVQPAEARPAETQPEVAETPQEMKPVETAEVQPEPEPPQKAVTRMPKPKVRTQEKPKPVEKKVPPKKTAGANGEGQQESQRGVAEGDRSAQSDRNSQAAGNNNGVGTAAYANYDGKVRSRIRRAIRKPRGVEGTVVVAFSVNGAGGLTSVRVVNGSGVAEIDQLAVDAIRRAAPFGPTPGGGARSFTALPITIE